LSVEELVRATLDRTARFDRQLNSYITVAGDQALDAARHADDELRRGVDRGPLHGIPVSVKDHIDTAGIPTSAGSKALAGRIPATDAPVVRRLKDAGAIVIGKANMNQFAGGESGWNPDYGKMPNPRFPEFSVGGSSGGSASHVAAGLVPLSIGSDNGGSVRIPAALCGVVGLKPTFGRVSTDGVAPRSFSTEHVGPLARCLDDVALALEAISGHVPGSRSTHRKPVPAYAEDTEGVIGLRIGVDRDYNAIGDPAVIKGFTGALQVLESLGCSIRPITMPSSDNIFQVGNVIFQPEISLWFDALGHERADLAGIRNGMVFGAAISAMDYLRANQRRREIQIDFAKQIRDVDVVASPTYFLAMRPFPPDAQMGLGGYPNLGTYHPVETDGLRYTLPFNLLGLPAISVPCAIGDDGTVGLQVVARAWDERTVLRVAREYERATAWHTRRPKAFDE
jgi:aspartyl-tRNA(Asn)/glutamyl-tRNA(Gln) amidotransferase subunit A